MYDGRILSSQHTAVFTGSQGMALGHRKNKEQGFSLPWAMNIFTVGNLSSSLLCPLTRRDFSAVSALVRATNNDWNKMVPPLDTLQLLPFQSPISFAVEIPCFSSLEKTRQKDVFSALLPSVCCSLLGSTRSDLCLRRESPGANLIK